MFAELIKKLLFGGGAGKRGSVSSSTENIIKKDLESVKQALISKSPSQLKQAVMTADRALDAALKDIVSGETMGDRLKNAQPKFDQIVYNKIWEAHKIRNSLAHEAGYEPPYYVLIGAIDNLKKGLEVLKVRL